jgi:DMSO reductase family type II enzyme heme b subunit
MSEPTTLRNAAAMARALGIVAGAGMLAMPLATLGAQQPAGKAIYEKWCAGCHGDTGAGDGPAAEYMLPRPRDFTKGIYQIRSTASGELPTDADIMRVVSDGMPGTTMPEWKSKLSETERTAVVAYIKSLSDFFKGAAPKAITVGNAPSSSAETLADGREAFKKLECFKCHGEQGRGDGKSAPTLTDDFDHPIRAADLSQHWKFNGGSTVEEIYTRLRTGLDGTPMPSFSDAIDAKVVTDEQLWHVAQWVRSLSPEKAPEVREVVRASRVTGSLPRTPNDSTWAAAERYWIPLVGQIILKPRWFAPTVEGVWVQALHDDKQLTMRVSWSDPSRSPDPAWDEWLGRMTTSMPPIDSVPLAATQGPDRLTVQFPTRITEDAERPYFLGGDRRQPVYVWRWTSTPDQLEEGRQTGLGTFARGTTKDVTHAAVYDQGEWRLQLTRALVPRDTSAIPAFRAGTAIPIAFFAADGSSGEDEFRSSIGAWYAIYLDVPTPPRVYAAPAATMLLTAGLGVLVVARARRRERGNRRTTQEEI